MREPTCGPNAAAGALLYKLGGVGANEQILLGLIWPKCVEMSLDAPLEPFLAGLDVWQQLQTCKTPLFIRFALELDRKNRGIIERDRGAWLAGEAARRSRGAPPGRGTRSTRRKTKTKAGRR